MDELLQEIRCKLKGIRGGPKGRIPDYVKEIVADYTLKRREQNIKWEIISNEIGLSMSTLNRCCQNKEGNNINTNKSMIPVEVLPEVLQIEEKERKPKQEKIKLSDELTLETPTGFKLKGLALNDAVKLLKELS